MVDKITTSLPNNLSGQKGRPKMVFKSADDSTDLAKLTRKTADREQYKNAFYEDKREINRAKKEIWISFCDSIDSVNETSRFRKLPKDPVIYLTYGRIINRIKYGNPTGLVHCCRVVEGNDTNGKIIPTLVTIDKRWLAQGYTPKKWRGVRVVFIP